MAIFLATSDPTAKAEGDQIEVNFKSGKDTVAFALSLNQAFMLFQRLQRSSCDLMRETQERRVPACAEIIAFPSERTRRAS